MNTNQPTRNVRVARPERDQIELFPTLSLNQMLPHDDRARIVWAFVQTLNVEPLYAKIKVSDDTAGRSATEPRVLIGLWLMATLDGVGKARELARLCERDIRYRWILGGLTTNYHTLSDFRVDHMEFLDQLLVDTVASLVDQGLVPLETIAQDGMRVRANAGKSSFRRKPTLQQLQKESQQHLERLKKEAEEGTNEPADARHQAAQKRAACERNSRLDEALRQYEELSKQREKRKKGDGDKTRVSTTDPDARKMKMANGGFDPAYNVQFATDGTARMIVGVDVTNEGTDGGEMPPMHQKVCENYGKIPENMLVDSAFATKESVTTVESAGTKVVSTIPRAEQLTEHGKDPHSRQSGDTDEFEAYRKRMAEPAYQELYKQRPSIAEFPNAECRNRGLRQFPVRGLRKVKAVALWYAITFNLLRMVDLGVLAT